MQLLEVITDKQPKQQLNEGIPAAVLWVGSAIAAAIGAEIAIRSYEQWLLYLDKVNYKPDPRAIPDGMKIRGLDGKWMKWNASRGAWLLPPGSPQPKMSDLKKLWEEAINQSFTSKVLSRKFDFSDVDEDDMRRAIFAAKRNDVSMGKSTQKEFDKVHERWVQKGRDATFRGKIAKRANTFFRVAGLTGSLLSVTAFAYYYIQAREIKEAIDEDYRSGAIKNEREYQEAITNARASIVPVIMASIVALGVTQMFFLIISWATDKLAGKGAAYKALNKLSKIAQLGFGAASVYLVASERGRQALAELMVDIVFADKVDELGEIVWNWLGGNWQMFWSEKGLANPDLQSGVDNAKDEDPEKNPNIKVPAPATGGKSNLEQFF